MTDTVLSDDERQFIQELIDSPGKTLNVRFGVKGIVYVHYEQIIHERGLDYFEEFLQELERKGFLKRTDKVYNIFCPNCNFPNVYSRYSCPTCHSTHMAKIQLVQHPFCGYIGQKNMFRTETGLRCPNCNTDINESSQDSSDRSEYKTIGFSLECENGHRFVSPEITHLCPNCQAKFNHRESNYRPIYDYELTQKACDTVGNKVDKNAVIKKVQDLLEQSGYMASKNDEIVGFSSSAHEFSLTGKKGSKVLLFDVATLGLNDELIQLLGKKMDIENSTAIFLDTTGNKEIVSLGQVYGINVVNLTDGNWFNALGKWMTEYVASDKKKIPNRLR